MAWKDIPKKQIPGREEKKQRVSDRDQCPSCGKGNALSQSVFDDDGKFQGFKCRYCGEINKLGESIHIEEDVRIGNIILEKGDTIKLIENGGKYACVMAGINIDLNEREDPLFELRRQVPEENIFSHFPLKHWYVLGDNKPFAITNDKEQGEDLGYEEKPHITVAYGLENDEDLSKIKERLEWNYHSEEQISFFIKDGIIDIFENVENGECDCLIIKIQDVPQQLLDIRNWILDNYQNTQKFDEYKPHITIAYIKKGTCKEFVGRQVELNLTITPNDFIYSPKH